MSVMIICIILKESFLFLFKNALCTAYEPRFDRKTGIRRAHVQNPSQQHATNELEKPSVIVCSFIPVSLEPVVFV